jgi:Gram-negative bacterial TonB protein C-terminal
VSKRQMILTSLGFLGTFGSFQAQDLPDSQRVFTSGPPYIESIVKEPATPVVGAEGSVLIVFRTTEQGRIIDLRATGGTAAMERSAAASLIKWKIKPMLLEGGRPVQVISAVVFNFERDSVSVSAAKPLTANQLSPRIGYPCWNALAHQNSDAQVLCKKQAATTDSDRESSSVERFTAHDEYGLALLSLGRPDLALQQFNEAIQAAKEDLKPFDAEWAYVHWHRGLAESRSGDEVKASQDLAVVEESLKLAESMIGEPGAAYYRRMEEKLSSFRAQAPGGSETPRQQP